MPSADSLEGGHGQDGEMKMIWPGASLARLTGASASRMAWKCASSFMSSNRSTPNGR
jgi:hypothetical protein